MSVCQSVYFFKKLLGCFATCTICPWLYWRVSYYIKRRLAKIWWKPSLVLSVMCPMQYNIYKNGTEVSSCFVVAFWVLFSFCIGILNVSECDVIRFNVWRCMHRASSYNMYINQRDAQISVIKLNFPLDALHVSDYISPSSGATFYKLCIAFGICTYHTCGCCFFFSSIVAAY